MRRRSSNSNRPMAARDHDRCQRAAGQVLQQIGCQQQQQGDGHGADHAGELGLRARGFGDRRARGAAADRKPLEQPSGQVGGAQADHLLVRIDLGAGLGRIRARQDAGVGERHHGDGAAADHHLAEVGETDPRQRERRQALRQRTEHLHPGALVEAEHADRDRGAHDRDQEARDSLEALEQQDRRQRAGADRERRPVGLAAQHRLGDLHEVAQRPGAVDRKAEQLGQLADQHRERDAVHVAVADRLGQQLGDESQAHRADQDAHQPRHHRHHARQGHGAHRVASRERQHDRENHRGERGIRPQHQDAARAEQRVGEQRDDSGVQTVDSRDARSHCVRDSDRHQHRGQHQAGHQIVRQPGGFVPAEDLQSGQPTLPAVHALSFEFVRRAALTTSSRR